jgi:1-deoxy-D-xylulose-5-phosphate reductoisomerase
MMQRNLSILGSTGSIGTQALEVVRQHPDRFRAVALTAGRNHELLIAQALEFNPSLVVITNETAYGFVKEALAGTPIEVVTSAEGLIQAAALAEVNLVLTALVGFAGLAPTLAALEAGKDIALANKETLVVAGEQVMALAKAKQLRILPVDSEHSAIYQCLVGEPIGSIEKIILTASGGPFRGYSAAQLEQVTLAQALKHPNWSMGSKITIDSASMMNKGLEVIEARWLFDVPPEQIEIVVHPQSIVHSLVEFVDGSLKAQLGLPDMRLPIQYALGLPERLQNEFPRFSFRNYPSLTFEEVDVTVFRTVGLAYEALRRGGNAACILNAANEAAVAAFLNERIRFVDIFRLLELAMTKVSFEAHPSIEALYATDKESRTRVLEAV